jgi:predicted nucleic acid-binding protein
VEHVFVETNWVVGYAAPAHFREPSAVELLHRAERCEIELYVPNLALIEARKVILTRDRYQARDEVAGMREFLKRQIAAGNLRSSSRVEMDAVLSQYETHLNTERVKAPERIAELAANPRVNVLALDEEMLRRSTELATTPRIELQSFDLAVLASVLVWADRRRPGGQLLSFCEKDSDLQPWNKDGSRRLPIADLYDDAGVWVYGDYTMSRPPRKRK